MAGLVAIHLGLQYAVLVAGYPGLAPFARLFHLDGEVNVPAWYSTAALLLCAALLGLIGGAARGSDRRQSRRWLALALGFVLLSLDEGASLHERSVRPLRMWLDAGGLFYFTWVLPGAAIVLIVAVASLRFLAALPRSARWAFLTAGAMFVAGALGMELVTGRHSELYGEADMTYAALTALEEGLEMAGVVLFVRALLVHLRDAVGVVRVGVSGRRPSAVQGLTRRV